jgi:hypothetical protein
MLVMKSLMNETRTRPRVGWVRADQARGPEDVTREQSLLNDIKSRDRAIKRLEREIRDRSIKVHGIPADQLSQGADTYRLDVSFLDSQKRTVVVGVTMSWDEILSVIGPTMYGYILRRGPAAYNRLVGQYSFEGSLIGYLRMKLVDQCGTRQISILPHQIDTVLIQLKQLGLIAMTEKIKEDGEEFRGYTLTEAGEERLTRTKIQVRSV